MSDNENYQLISPNSVQYTQDSIASRFQDGSLLDVMLADILYKHKTPFNIEIIEVVQRSPTGCWWALTGNRRLFVYRELCRIGAVTQIPVIVRSWDSEEDSYLLQEQFRRRFTTVTGGKTIKCRQRTHFDQVISEWKERALRLSMQKTKAENMRMLQEKAEEKMRTLQKKKKTEKMRALQEKVKAEKMQTWLENAEKIVTVQKVAADQQFITNLDERRMVRDNLAYKTTQSRDLLQLQSNRETTYIDQESAIKFETSKLNTDNTSQRNEDTLTNSHQYMPGLINLIKWPLGFLMDMYHYLFSYNEGGDRVRHNV